MCTQLIIPKYKPIKSFGEYKFKFAKTSDVFCNDGFSTDHYERETPGGRFRAKQWSVKDMSTTTHLSWTVPATSGALQIETNAGVEVLLDKEGCHSPELSLLSCMQADVFSSP